MINVNNRVLLANYDPVGIKTNVKTGHFGNNKDPPNTITNNGVIDDSINNTTPHSHHSQWSNIDQLRELKIQLSTLNVEKNQFNKPQFSTGEDIEFIIDTGCPYNILYEGDIPSLHIEFPMGKMEFCPGLSPNIPSHHCIKAQKLVIIFVCRAGYDFCPIPVFITNAKKNLLCLHTSVILDVFPINPSNHVIPQVTVAFDPFEDIKFLESNDTKEEQDKDVERNQFMKSLQDDIEALKQVTGPIKGHKYSLNLVKGANLDEIPTRPINQKGIFKEEVDKFKDALIPFSAKLRDDAKGVEVTMFAILQPTAQQPMKMRVVTDCVNLNVHVKGNNNFIPLIKTIFEKIFKKNMVITQIDIKAAYTQVEWENNGPFYVYFTHNGVKYAPKRVIFGLADLPAFFNRMMMTLFGHLQFTSYFFDNLIVISEPKVHLEEVQKVLRIMIANNIPASIDKCEFYLRKINLLGYHYENDQFKPQKQMIDELVNFPIPQTMSELQSFRGLFNYVSAFIPYAYTYYCLLDKEMSTIKSSRLSQAERTRLLPHIEQMKMAAACAIALVIPPENPKLVMTTDACRKGMGAALFFRDEKDESILHPMQLYSHSFTPTQQKYSVHKLECLGLVLALRRFKPYLECMSFEVLTDNQILSTFNRTKTYTSELVPTEWLIIISQYDFQLTLIPGIQNTVADALSRLGVNIVPKVITDKIFLNSNDAFYLNPNNYHINYMKQLLDEKDLSSSDQIITYELLKQVNEKLQIDHHDKLPTVFTKSMDDIQHYINMANNTILYNKQQDPNYQLVFPVTTRSKTTSKILQQPKDVIMNDKSPTIDNISNTTSIINQNEKVDNNKITCKPKSVKINRNVGKGNAQQTTDQNVIDLTVTTTITNEAQQYDLIKVPKVNVTNVADARADVDEILPQHVADDIYEAANEEERANIKILRNKLIQFYHCKHGHVNYKTMQLLLSNQGYRWKHMLNHCLQFAMNCDVCIATNVKKTEKVPTSPALATRPLQFIQIDCVGPLFAKQITLAKQRETYNKSKRKNKTDKTDKNQPPTNEKGEVELYALAVLDIFSGFSNYYPLFDLSEKSIKNAMGQYIRTFGHPTLIQSDNAPYFEAKEFQNWITDLGIAYRFSPVRHPESNGRVERNIGVFKAMLQKLIIEKGYQVYI